MLLSRFFAVLAGWLLAAVPLTAHAISATGTQLFIWQGPNAALDPAHAAPGLTVEARAQVLAANDVVVVSHGFNVIPHGTANAAATDMPPVATNCMDTGDPLLSQVLARARQINGQLKIFAYVPATADTEDVVVNDVLVSSCQLPAVPHLQDCSGGICENFVWWVNKWLAFEQSSGVYLDGFMIDYSSSTAITVNTRNNVFSFARSTGKAIMANILTPLPVPTGTAGNDYVRFAGEWLQQNPPLNQYDSHYVLMEGFYFGGGLDAVLGNASLGINIGNHPNRANYAITDLLNMNAQTNEPSQRPVLLAAAATVPSFHLFGGLVNCQATDIWAPFRAYQQYLRVWSEGLWAKGKRGTGSIMDGTAITGPGDERWRPGSVFQYTNADLGTLQWPNTQGPRVCNNSNFPAPIP